MPYTYVYVPTGRSQRIRTPEEAAQMSSVRSDRAYSTQLQLVRKLDASALWKRVEKEAPQAPQIESERVSEPTGTNTREENPKPSEGVSEGSEPTVEKVRAWAKEKGYTVKNGYVTKKLIEEYKREHSQRVVSLSGTLGADGKIH